MATLFISDLHLSPEHPEITACFVDFLQQNTTKMDALYILGDLFESWIGDDDHQALHQEIAEKLKNINQTGIPIYFIHGNRDFLVGQAFAKSAGMVLLPDHQVIDLYGTPTLIMHGDTLCTQDEGYQKYRKIVHNKFVQWLYFLLPLRLRRKIGNSIQKNSGDQKQLKSAEIMDVDPQTTIEIMQQYAVSQLIHGHTHRPAIHHFDLEIQSAPSNPSHSPQKIAAQRIVLGDWYTQGSFLICDAQHCELKTLSFTDVTGKPVSE